jgi:hypothetical protein
VIPSNYTEDMLKSYMVGRVKSIADLLGMTIEDFAESVNDVLVAYGVNDISEATDITKLRALAHYQAWVLIAEIATGEYQFSADGGSFNRKQIYDNAVATLERLRITYAPYLPSVEEEMVEHRIEVGTTTHYDYYTEGPDAFIFA